MERTILNWVPDNWDKSMSSLSWCKRVELERNSEEFLQLQFEIRTALGNRNKHIRLIERNQSIYDFGQVLIRGQLLLTLNPCTSYYRVRRYIKIRANYLQAALNNNLDHRRCGMNSLDFQMNIPEITSEEILLVIQVITSNKNENYISPKNSSDYYIEYIVMF